MILDISRYLVSSLISRSLMFFLSMGMIGDAWSTSAEDLFYFSIPKQQVDMSLNIVAHEANITLIYPFEELSTKNAEAIVGFYTVKDVLLKILEGTGYRVKSRDRKYFSIIRNNKIRGLSAMNNTKKTSTAIVAFISSLVGANQVLAQNELVDEEVIVTGIRGSIERGLDAKENASSIVDGAFSEELGKFPDTNVAESLQRITGVAITRARGGEGQFVTVRGLGEEFNAVTYNGRVLATENAGREFSFDVIASELISSAEVYKSTTASQGDGSIGGLVNIQSQLPLDNPGFNAAWKLASPYEERDESFGLTASGVVSTSWNDDTMGMLLSFSHQKRDTRSDVAESIGFTTVPDQNGNGVAERVNSTSVGVAFQERERTGGTLAFQYLPDENTEIVIDALYTKFESPSIWNAYSFFPAAANVDLDSLVVSDDDVAVGHTTAATGEFLARFNETDTETTAIGANLKRAFSDKFSGEFDFSYSEADGQRDNVGSAAGSGKFYVLQIFNGEFTKRPSSGPVPSVTYTVPNAAGDQVPFDQVTIDQVDLSFSRNTVVETTDEVLSLKADFEYEIGDGAWISFGTDYVSREKSNQAFDNSATWCGANGVNIFCGTGEGITTWNPGATLGFIDDDVLGGEGNLPGAIPVVALEDVELALANLAASTAGVDDFLELQKNLSSSNVIEEDVLGAYIQLDIEGDIGNFPYRMNAGFRVAQTELTSSGFGGQIGSALFDDSNPNIAPVQNFNVNATEEIAVDNSYVDVLPSFNIALELSDESQLRGSFSQTLTRPTLTDLSTFFSVTSSTFGNEQITQLNPLLEPVRSNNLDLSYEYYGSVGLSYSVAGFYKDISDFITNQNIAQAITVDNVTNNQGNTVAPITTNFQVSGPQNGDSAEVFGLEVAAQYLTDSGFGVSGNVTLAGSEATSGGVSSDLENISDSSANLSVFYEENNIQARISANYRSEYLANTAGEGGLMEFVDDYTQVDLSLAYDIAGAFGLDKSLLVFVEGSNIFDEHFYRYAETRNLLETYEVNGPRWTLGVRGSF